MMHAFLGNTFFRDAVSLSSEDVFGSRLPLGVSTSTEAFVLYDKFCALLVCDAPFRKIASRVQRKTKLIKPTVLLMIIGDEQSFVS